MAGVMGCSDFNEGLDCGLLSGPLTPTLSPVRGRGGSGCDGAAPLPREGERKGEGEIRELPTGETLRYSAVAQASASTSPSKSALPSVQPCSSSLASSGWGIRPSTVLVSLKMPAMLRAEPLALSSSVIMPSSRQ